MTTIQGHKKQALVIILIGILVFMASFAVPQSGAILQNGQSGFGNSTIGTEIDSSAANTQSASGFTCDVTASSTSITAYIGREDSNGYSQAAVYSDSNGLPGNLITSSNSATTSTTMGWVTYTIPNTQFTSGTFYWLSLCSDDRFDIAIVLGTGTRVPNLNTFGSFVSNFGGVPWGTHDEGAMSIYVTMTGQTPSPTPSASPIPTQPPANTLFTLTVVDSPTNGGTVQFGQPPHQAIDLNHATYYAGSAIALQAMPASGFKFDHWIVVPTNGGTAITIFNNPLPPQNIESDLTVTAFYTTIVPTPTPTATPHTINTNGSSYASDMQIVGGIIAAIGAIYYVMPKKTGA